jgi:hypothetical protein
MSLESAFMEVLMPFVSERIREKALNELLDLLSRELADLDSPLIEVHAPVELHERISEVLRERSIAAGISEAETLQVVSAGRKIRFESMAQRWIDVLREGET